MSNTTHFDEIDFIKGIAAISVLFLHTLPVSVLKGTLAIFHIWQAVPVFLFVSFYLGFRGLENKSDVFKGYFSKDRIKKLFIRIWLPLLILAALESVFFFVVGRKDRAMASLLCYDNGPGSYYVWCYMQIWFLMPVIYLLLKRFGIAVGGGILLIIGVLLDFLWERYVGIRPGYTCFRYIFLSVPAFMYLKGFEVRKLIPLVIISMIYLVLITYTELPIYADPLLPNGWEDQTGLSFFFTLGLFVLVSTIFAKLKNTRLKQYITHLGTISWQVFLVQMVLIGSGILDAMSSMLFDLNMLRVGFNVTAALVITLPLAVLYNKVLVAIRANKENP